VNGRYPPPLLPGRLRASRLTALDAVLAFVLTVGACGNLAAGNVRPPDGLPAWPGWIAAAGVGLPVLLRRRWPVPALAASTAIAALATAAGFEALGYLPTALVMYVVAAAEPRRGSVVTIVVCLGFTTMAQVILLRADALGALGVAAAVLTVAWLAGRIARERRTAAELAAEQTLAEERLRIARELHDIVAHGMSLIAVKAAVANHVALERPVEARDALQVIETTSREALAELRRMLGVLRSGDRSGVPAETGPAPGIAALPSLVERAAAAGVRAELDVRTDDELPEGIGLAVYRIVQEAVTNVIKHAGPATCRIGVITRAGWVRVEVTDDGLGRRSTPVAATGHGLLGMRERVSLYGGELHAGPGADGGFTVLAELPYGAVGALA
jgi:signal transduction histidine kinase